MGESGEAGHIATYNIEGSHLVLRFGDIAESTSEVVVASDDTELSMGGTGTAAALLAKAGPELRAAAQDHAGCAVGSSVVTDAYGLADQGVRHVVHAVTRERDAAPAAGEAEAQREVIRSATRSCLDQMSAVGGHSITFPALGTGFADFEPPEVAAVMATEIRDYLREQPENLEVEVRLLSSDNDAAAADTAEFTRSFTAAADLAPELTRTHLVLLVHGIRSPMRWQAPVTVAMEAADDRLDVQAVSYGWFGFRSMLSRRARQKPIEFLARRLAETTASGDFEHVSAIAHSFGTFALGEALVQDPGLRLHRFIAVGAIMAKDFPDRIRAGQLSPLPEDGRLFVNEFSFKDWAARVAGWLGWFGFGSPGFDGFGDPRVKDCEHRVGHSGYFDTKYPFPQRWAEIIATGRVPEGSLGAE